MQKLFLLILCVYGWAHIWAVVHIRRTEGNLRELDLSFHHVDLRAKLRLSGLVASTVTHGATSLAPHCATYPWLGT